MGASRVREAVMGCCPHCNGTGQLPEAGPALAVAGIAASLRAACRATGAPISGDDRVDEVTAAMLLGKSRKTLSNWRHLDRPLSFITRNGRVLYLLEEIARWLVENGREPEN